jgi:anti-sigma factor RsiW
MMTMKCNDVRLLLVSFADGALAGARAEAVRTHLAGCARCREELAQLAADAELLRREEKPDVPAYLGSRIMAGIRACESQPRPWFGLSRAMARVAAVALVAVGVWLGTALARGMAGPQQSLTDRLAQVGAELPDGEDK